MSDEVVINLIVNGERVRRRVEARRHLVDFLRLDLGLMGTHTGCEHGACGTCTVRIDGLIARGCLVLAASLGAGPWHPATIGAAQAALDRDLDPPADQHGGAEMKRHLARVLLARALVELDPASKVAAA